MTGDIQGYKEIFSFVDPSLFPFLKTLSVDRFISSNSVNTHTSVYRIGGYEGGDILLSIRTVGDTGSDHMVRQLIRVLHR